MQPVALKLLCVGALSLLISPAMAAEKPDAAAKKLAPVKAEVQPKKASAGKGAITLKKNDGGSLELSNLNDDEDAELLVESQDKSKGESSGSVAADRTDTASRNDDPGDPAERAERRAQNDRQRNEGDGQRGGAIGAIGASSSTGSAAGSNYSGVGYAGGGASEGGYSADGNPLPGSGGSAAPNVPKATVMPTASPENNAIMPNPRPGTEQAVPSTADTGSTANQEKYRNLMVQEAATGVVNRTQAAVENPAAVRRYIATDRATYQKTMGY